MYNNDPKTLNAGAYANLPQQDIRLSGDQTPQNQQMASDPSGVQNYFKYIRMHYSQDKYQKVQHLKCSNTFYNKAKHHNKIQESWQQDQEVLTHKEEDSK